MACNGALTEKRIAEALYADLSNVDAVSDNLADLVENLLSNPNAAKIEVVFQTDNKVTLQMLQCIDYEKFNKFVTLFTILACDCFTSQIRSGAYVLFVADVEASCDEFCAECPGFAELYTANWADLTTPDRTKVLQVFYNLVYTECWRELLAWLTALLIKHDMMTEHANPLPPDMNWDALMLRIRDCVRRNTDSIVDAVVHCLYTDVAQEDAVLASHYDVDYMSGKPNSEES